MAEKAKTVDETVVSKAVKKEVKGLAKQQESKLTDEQIAAFVARKIMNANEKNTAVHRKNADRVVRNNRKGVR